MEDTPPESTSSASTMIEAILDAPTSAGIPQDQPSLTNLDRSTWYALDLKRVNPKLLDHQLSVSVRLALSAHFALLTDEQEAALWSKWKILHPKERLFDVRLIKSVKHSEDDEDDGKEDEIEEEVDTSESDIATLDWAAKSPKLKLRIRFNVTSSQFPFKRSAVQLQNAIFSLHIKVASHATDNLIDSSYCQVGINL